MKSFMKTKSIQLVLAALILGVILTAGLLGKSERAEAKTEVRMSPMFAQSLSNSIMELEGKKEKAPQQNVNMQNLSFSNNQIVINTPTTSYSCGATCGYSCGATCGSTCGSTCVGHSTCAGSSTCVGSSTCNYTCSYTCATTCNTTCTGKSTCAGSSTCVGTSTCNYTCSYTCGTTCNSTCVGKSTCAGSSTCLGSSTCNYTCSFTCTGKATCAGTPTCANSPACKGTPSNPPSGGNSGSNNPKVNAAAWGNILPDNDPKLSEKLACLNDMAWNGKNYVLVGRGKILTSSDGIKWNITYSADLDQTLYGVVWNGKEYTAVGTNETKNAAMAMKSSDGRVWKAVELGFDGCLWDIAWNGKLYVAAGSKGVLATSTNGVNWTKASISSTSDFAKVIWANNLFVAVGNGIITTSPNGRTWNTITGQTGNFHGVAYYKGTYCICDANCKLLTTKDFVKWGSKKVSVPSGSSSYSNAVNAVSGKDMFYIGLSDNRILSSSDMTNWKLNSLSKDYGVNNIKALNNKVFAMGPSSLYVYAPQSTTSSNLQVSVLVNGKAQNISPAPYMQGSIPMFPLKVLQAAGSKITTSGNRITITKGTKKVILTAGSSSASLNGKTAALETKTVLKSGTLYAPLKKVVGALGGTYVWTASTKTVTIKF